MDDTKRPRQYAAEIAALPTREARVTALARVPEHLREWVKFYVAEYFPTLKRFQQSANDAFERDAHQQAKNIRRIDPSRRDASLQPLTSLSFGDVGTVPPMSGGEFGGAVLAILMIWLGREWTEKSKQQGDEHG